MLWTGMQHVRSTTIIRLAALLGATWALAACGGSTAESAPTGPTVPVAESTVAPTSSAVTVPPTAPTTTRETTPPETTPATTTPATTPTTTTTPPTTAAPAVAMPCGEFGPIPPRPDSMPTVLMDTDGDGDTDEVTAYGAADGWRIRVVEDDVISEALVDAIGGWAYLAEPMPGPGGAVIVLVDNDTAGEWHFATHEAGCIAPLSTPIVDELAAPDVVDDADELVCGPLPPVPADAMATEPFWFDLNDDGIADDLLVAYFSDGVWKLRSELQTWDGGPLAQSEVEIPGAGAHGVEVIGFADIDATYGGEEILAKVGGGASSIEIGYFTWLEGGCLTQYESAVEAAPFTTFVGATIGHAQGLICGDGYLLRWGWMLDDDGTYSYHDAAFEGVALGTLGYMPASDGFAEGLTQDELPAELFDCNGLSI